MPLLGSKFQGCAADLDVSVRIGDDLTYCRIKGNMVETGTEGSVEPFEEARLQQAVNRIAIVLTCWLLRLLYGSAGHSTSHLTARL